MYKLITILLVIFLWFLLIASFMEPSIEIKDETTIVTEVIQYE